MHGRYRYVSLTIDILSAVLKLHRQVPFIMPFTLNYSFDFMLLTGCTTTDLDVLYSLIAVKLMDSSRKPPVMTS